MKCGAPRAAPFAELSHCQNTLPCAEHSPKNPHRDRFYVDLAHPPFPPFTGRVIERDRTAGVVGAQAAGYCSTNGHWQMSENRCSCGHSWFNKEMYPHTDCACPLCPAKVPQCGAVSQFSGQCCEHEPWVCDGPIGHKGNHTQKHEDGRPWRGWPQTEAEIHAQCTARIERLSVALMQVRDVASDYATCEDGGDDCTEPHVHESFAVLARIATDALKGEK